MRPSLNILDEELTAPDRRRGEAGPGRGRDGDPRAGDAPPAARSRAAARPLRRARALPARCRGGGDRRRRRRRSCSTTGTASRTPTSVATGSTSCPGSSGLKVLDHRTGETRLANSTDFVEYVRLADGLPNIPYLATAFSTNNDIEAAGLRRVAAVHDPDQLEQAGRLGRLHRARRAADGRDDAALPARPGRPHRPPDVDLHDHRDRQLPLQRGLLPEPHRLRRGGHRGRDRAGHADGPHRPGHDRRARRSSTPSTCWPGSRWPRSSDPGRRSCSAGRRRPST